MANIEPRKIYGIGLENQPSSVRKEILDFRDTFRTEKGSTDIAFLCLGGNNTTCAWEGADCHRAAVFAGFGCKERSAPSRTHVVLFSSVEFLNTYGNRLPRRIFHRICKSRTLASFGVPRGARFPPPASADARLSLGEGIAPTRLSAH